ncbi:MAG UNVERIFIED_CONTAM: conjugal transfer protein TraG N-terminal domain-containing protein [Rickettsiaceae bacterium]|jgi:hypothetical protein
MGIQFAIHTYGYYDAMFYVVNGIKMIMDSDFTGAMIKLIAMIATSYYAVAGMAGAADGRLSHYFLKTVGMIMVVNALLMPKADILVIDRITGKKEVVRDLPYAFVLPVGILEAIGAGMTSIFEQAFSKVSSAPYKDYGLIFGQKIVAEAKDWKIMNPEFSRNMDEFISRCIVLEAMIGYRFTPADVQSSNDLFDLATSNAGTFRKVNFNINKNQVSLNCKEAGGELKQYFKKEMGILNFKYKDRDFSLAGNALLGIPGADMDRLNNILAKNIEIGYKKNFGINSKAEDIVRQNMMINALKGFSNKTDLYGYTRASALQNSNWAVYGELAKEYLPLLLNIIKALIYASFIFIVPLMILGGGMDKYMKYCVVIFSLQIWPALNSILNLFIELYSETRGIGITNGMITAANFNGAHQAIDTIVYVASGLQMSIPFLSFAIVQGGVSSFIHLAGSLQSASSSAASTASQEMESGNRSFDSISLGSQSIDNRSGFKTDWNQSYMEGAQQYQTASGGIYKNFQDGSSAMNTGASINASTGGRRFSLDSSTQAGYQQSLASTLDSIKSDETNLGNSKSSGINAVNDLVTELAKRESKGETFNYETMGEEGKALQHAVAEVKENYQNKDKTHTKDRGGSLGFNGGVKAESPKYWALLLVVEFQGDIVFGRKNSTNKVHGESSKASDSNDAQELNSNLVRAAQNKTWMKDNNINTSFAERTTTSFDQMQSYQDSIARKRDEAESYRSAIEYSKNNGASDSRDMYHEVEQKVMDDYKVNRETAHEMIEKYDPRVDRVWDGMVKENMGNVISKVNGGKSYVEGHGESNHATFAAIHSNKVNKDANDALRQEAANNGLNRQKVQNDIDETKRTNTQEHEAIMNANAEKRNAVLAQNDERYKKLKPKY